MSGVVVIAPIVATAAWPVLCSAAAAVMGAVGLTAVNAQTNTTTDVATETNTRVELDLANSEEVGTTIRRDEELVFANDSLKVIFSRDARGKLKICVEGSGYSKAELEQFGRDIAGRVVQQYAYLRIVQEMQARHLSVVDQSVDADDNIHIKLRGWED
ncbi:MAG: hypothetical protein GX617_05800 [Lentisphaerae bacterium]|nr:hypothetical protein [Lentisphaerota bacterium]